MIFPCCFFNRGNEQNVKQFFNLVVNLSMNTLRKLIIVSTLLLSSLRLMAPSTELLTITRPDPIEPYTGLIHAIGMVETKGDTLAYNPVEPLGVMPNNHK